MFPLAFAFLPPADACTAPMSEWEYNKCPGLCLNGLLRRWRHSLFIFYGNLPLKCKWMERQKKSKNIDSESCEKWCCKKRQKSRRGGEGWDRCSAGYLLLEHTVNNVRHIACNGQDTRLQTHTHTRTQAHSCHSCQKFMLQNEVGNTAEARWW